MKGLQGERLRSKVGRGCERAWAMFIEVERVEVLWWKAGLKKASG